MILAAHQPQYLAWAGYYHKMSRCDVFVYLDEVQYKKREFQNRNRIKAPEGELWLTLPILSKGRYTQSVKDVALDATKDWAQSHWKSLLLNYAKAPHFAEHRAFYEGVYAKPWERLAPLCVEMDGYLRKELGIGADVRFESETGSEGTASERLVSICRRLKADTYLSGQGGKDYLDEPAFAKAGIKVEYQTFSPEPYPQRFPPFVPNLAAVDILLNCGSKAARDSLRAA
ncbi:MAG: WbqC family protein [Elusimicrobia bacterium]|nr:WbqC family protein [Elusimicrobiota bacterium]